MDKNMLDDNDEILEKALEYSQYYDKLGKMYETMDEELDSMIKNIIVMQENMEKTAMSSLEEA